MSNLKPLQARLAACKNRTPADLLAVKQDLNARHDAITQMLRRYNEAHDLDKRFKITGVNNDYVMFNLGRDSAIVDAIIEILGKELAMLDAQYKLLSEQIAMVDQVAVSAFAVVAAK